MSVLCGIWIIISDWGFGIFGFGENNYIFLIEYLVNFIVMFDKGINLIYWWRFGDGFE